MCSSQGKERSKVTPSIFTDGEGIKTWSAILIRKDDAFLRLWAVLTKISVVFEGFTLSEFDVKYADKCQGHEMAAQNTRQTTYMLVAKTGEKYCRYFGFPSRPISRSIYDITEI